MRLGALYHAGGAFHLPHKLWAHADLGTTGRGGRGSGSLTRVADLASGYNIIEKLGTGAKSTIYKVVDPKTGKTYALKRVIREAHEDNRFLEQAITEYEISHQADHPALRRAYEICKLRKWGIQLTEVQVVMEYVQGVSLEQHRPTDMVEIVDLFLKVGDGIEALHKLGFLHTDLKPNNILTCVDGTIKIIDFGQGCPIGFRKRRIQGTPDYIAPEQVMRRPLTQQTDIFNFGATLYWVLTGRAYPTAYTNMVTKKPERLGIAHSRGVPAPRDINEAVPIPLSRLVMESCNEKPYQRPRDMRNVISRLEAVHHLLTRKPESPPEPEIPPEADDDHDHLADPSKL